MGDSKSECSYVWEKYFLSYTPEDPSQQEAVCCCCCYCSLSLECFFHPEEHCSTIKTLVPDLILMSTPYYLCLKVQESFTKSSTDFKRLSCKKYTPFFSHAFIHRIGTALAFIPLDCVFTPSQLHVSMLPCVDCTSTEVFEQDYLFLTPQLKYGSGKRICPAVSQILCTIAKFHHCSAASKGHHFYVI